MEKYNIELANQVYASLNAIYEHKKEYNQNSAINFVNGFFEELKNLPHRGINKPSNNRALVYKKHLIIYHIQEPTKVLILDVIDPRQDSLASKYY